MKKTSWWLIASTLASCTSMNESLKLGAGLGALTGVATSHIGRTSTGAESKLEDAALGAGIGIGIGLITSYFTHKAVEVERIQSDANQTEVFFGDLPPSPFIVPRSSGKKRQQ
jgi:hypothetical protein